MLCYVRSCIDNNDEDVKIQTLIFRKSQIEMLLSNYQQTDCRPVELIDELPDWCGCICGCWRLIISLHINHYCYTLRMTLCVMHQHKEYTIDHSYANTSGKIKSIKAIVRRCWRSEIKTENAGNTQTALMFWMHNLSVLIFSFFPLSTKAGYFQNVPCWFVDKASVHWGCSTLKTILSFFYPFFISRYFSHFALIIRFCSNH